MKDEASGAVRTTQTDSQGFYAVEALEPGTYTVTVMAKGFTTSVTKGEAIAPGQQRSDGATLAVGSLIQQVTVQANPVQVETQSSAISSTITANHVANIMVNGRNFQALGQLAPGAPVRRAAMRCQAAALAGERR